MAKLKGALPPIAYQSFIKLFLSMGAVGPVGLWFGFGECGSPPHAFVILVLVLVLGLECVHVSTCICTKFAVRHRINKRRDRHALPSNLIQ